MVTSSVQKQIAKLRTLLKKRQVVVKKLILFGSHARQLATKRSDVDICVVCDTRSVRDPKELQSYLNCDAGMAGMNMDIIVTTYRSFRNDKLSPILHEIRKHGIEV